MKNLLFERISIERAVELLDKVTNAVCLLDATLFNVSITSAPSTTYLYDLNITIDFL